jgi:hypothetical protein
MIIFKEIIDMSTKFFNSRISLKHDIEANWMAAGNSENGFYPMAGEVIIYDVDDTCAYLRYKIGRKDAEGNLININDLPFVTNIYVGPDEPKNAPIGFIWVETAK